MVRKVWNKGLIRIPIMVGILELMNILTNVKSGFSARLSHYDRGASYPYVLAIRVGSLGPLGGW
jgi:hypothetical protein